MQVSPTSNTNQVTGIQGQAPTNKSQPASQQQADTVQLSPAAQARLRSGDVDHDGDSH